MTFELSPHYGDNIGRAAQEWLLRKGQAEIKLSVVERRHCCEGYHQEVSELAFRLLQMHLRSIEHCAALYGVRAGDVASYLRRYHGAFKRRCIS